MPKTTYNTRFFIEHYYAQDKATLQKTQKITSKGRYVCYFYCYYTPSLIIIHYHSSILSRLTLRMLHMLKSYENVKIMQHNEK